MPNETSNEPPHSSCGANVPPRNHNGRPSRLSLERMWSCCNKSHKQSRYTWSQFSTHRLGFIPIILLFSSPLPFLLLSWKPHECAVYFFVQIINKAVMNTHTWLPHSLPHGAFLCWVSVSPNLGPLPEPSNLLIPSAQCHLESSFGNLPYDCKIYMPSFGRKHLPPALAQEQLRPDGVFCESI